MSAQCVYPKSRNVQWLARLALSNMRPRWSLKRERLQRLGNRKFEAEDRRGGIRVRQGRAPSSHCATCEQESDAAPSIDVASHAIRIRNPMALLEVFRFRLLQSTLDFAPTSMPASSPSLSGAGLRVGGTVWRPPLAAGVRVVRLMRVGERQVAVAKGVITALPGQRFFICRWCTATRARVRAQRRARAGRNAGQVRLSAMRRSESCAAPACP